MRISSVRKNQKHFHNFLFPSFFSSFIPFVSMTIILSVCSVLKAQTDTVDQKPFEYKVFMQKDTFLVGELIDIGVNIINTSNVVQKSGYVNIKMFNEADKVLSCNYESSDLFSPKNVILKRNDESYMVIQLNNFFGKQHSWHSKYYIKKGTYTIKVYFSLDAKSKPDIIERVIKIIEPKGDEAVVYNSYVEIVRRKPYNPERTAVDLELLNEANPKSIYSPMILSDLCMTYWIFLKDDITADKVAKKLAENYPWSSEALPKLEDNLLNKMIPNRMGRIEYLKKIMPGAKNSPMQKLLEIKLKEEMED